MDAPHKSSQLTWPLDLFFGESTKAVEIPGHFWNPWIIKKFNKKIMSHSSFRFFFKPRVIQLEVSKFGRFFSARCALAMQVTWSITGWQWCVFPRCCSFFWWRTDFCEKIYRRFLWHVLLQLFLWDCCVPQSMSKMDFLYWSIFLPDSLSHTTHNALPSFKATAIKHHHTTTTNT